jgi:hypothetical protein
MASVLISYRRDDEPHVAGRLRDRLVQTFGEDNVFFDVHSIGYGEDFRTSILGALSQVGTTIVLIGSGWSVDRLQDPEDYVRLEIAESFRLGKTVIPVLLDDASMPAAGRLPGDVRDLVYLQSPRLRRDPDFHDDVDNLIRILSPPPTGPVRPGAPPAKTVRTSGRRAGVLTATIVSLLIVAVVGFVGYRFAQSALEVDSGPPGGGEPGCWIRVSNRLTVIQEQPRFDAQEIVSVPNGDYMVLSTEIVDFGGLQDQRWFRIEVDGRQGWLRDSTFNIDAKSADCP